MVTETVSLVKIIELSSFKDLREGDIVLGEPMTLLVYDGKNLIAKGGENVLSYNIPADDSIIRGKIDLSSLSPRIITSDDGKYNNKRGLLEETRIW